MGTKEELSMMTYEKLAKRPAVFSRLTGVTIEEFATLHDVFKSFWEQFVFETFVKGKDRKRVTEEEIPHG